MEVKDECLYCKRVNFSAAESNFYILINRKKIKGKVNLKEFIILCDKCPPYFHRLWRKVSREEYYLTMLIS